jgi:hypothetical protein
MRGISQEIQNVKKLRSGSLLVEVTREAQANNLLSLTEFASVPVKVSAHRSLNTTKGVIRSLELSKLGTDELVAELSSQGVTAAQNIFQTRDGQKRKISTIILTFSLAKLPTKIRTGYEMVSVEPYIPNPLRCFKCQQFGHGQSTCSRKPICPKCGLDAHGDDACNRTPICINCKGDHPSYVPICPMWQKEKEICKVKVLQGVSFADARKIILASSQTPVAGVSYASVTASKLEMKTVATQTEIVNCKCQATVDTQKPKESKSTNTLTVELNRPTSSKASTTSQSRKSPVPQEKKLKTSIKRVQSVSPSSRDKQSKNKTKSEKQSDRSRKGSGDPINLYNRYVNLEEMEGDFSDGESQSNKQPFRPAPILPP